MKKNVFLFILLMVFTASGCAHSKKDLTNPKIPKRGKESVRASHRVKITLGDLNTRTQLPEPKLSGGIREMFVSALTNSGRFSFAEEVNAADIVISLIITEFNPEASGGRKGTGGGGGSGRGKLGGLLGVSVNKAHMALEVRLIDSKSSKVLAETVVRRQASDASGQIMNSVFLRDWPLSAPLSHYAGTPTEKAIRVCVFEAVRFISQNIPASYYKS